MVRGCIDGGDSALVVDGLRDGWLSVDDQLAPTLSRAVSSRLLEMLEPLGVEEHTAFVRRDLGHGWYTELERIMPSFDKSFDSLGDELGDELGDALEGMEEEGGGCRLHGNVRGVREA